MSMQTPAERRRRDSLQGAHWTGSLLNRWLRGTHADTVNSKTRTDENAGPGNVPCRTFRN